jgi:unsaturated rhamnogalacturonyl hydrolase
MKKLTSLTRLTLIAGFFLAAAGSAVATVTVTSASGGGSISADTASNAPAPAWTTLGAITITEGASTDFTNGNGVTLVLKAPAGFQFNTAVTPNVTFTAGKNITSASAVMTDASTITITLTVSGAAVSGDSLTIGSTTGIQVRPTAIAPLATDNHIYRPSTGGGTAGIRGITNSVDGSSGSDFGDLTEAPGTPSTAMPSQSQIMNAMLLANDYFTNEWPNPGCSTCLSGGHPTTIWTRATYIEGAMALWRVNQDRAITNYATQWGAFTNWTIRYGATDTSPDDQCAGSEYIELYLLNTTLTNRITNIVANLNYWMFTNSTTTNWWWYIDGVHMSMPAFAKMAAISASTNANFFAYNTNYAYKMYSYFHYTKSVLAPSNGLYNLTDHLWCRDSNYLANYKASDGTTQKCYWSRGNGWVFAGLARTLDVLPSTDAHFSEYSNTFQQMAAALIPVQRSDGFWNMNLAYTNDYPGPESSGTAMFTYGLAWGIHHGYLDAPTYLPTVIKGWNALTTFALHPTSTTNGGFIGFVQSSGSSPTNNPPVTYTAQPDFDDFTLGALLLAGSEIYQLTNLSQAITFGTLGNHTYGDAPITLSASASSGLSVSFSVLSGPASITGNTLTITGAGTVSVQASQAGNTTYAATNMIQSFTVSPVALAVSANPQSKTYGNVDPTLTWQLTSGSLVSGDNFAGGLTRVPGESIGAYAILQGTLTAGTNYSLTYTGANLTIGQKAIAVTADPKSKTYGDVDPALTWQLTGGSLVSGDGFVGGLLRTTGENAGLYAILQGTLTAGANYNLTYTGANLTISQKSLTITADNKSKTAGLANPVLTASYNGFVNNENTNVFTSQVTLSTTADINSPAGTTYPITASGAVAVNYSFNYVPGLLTVVAKPDLTGISVSGNQSTLNWPTLTGQNYQVEFKDNLNDPAWTPLGVPQAGTGYLLNATDNSNNVPHRFYRLLITQP